MRTSNVVIAVVVIAAVFLGGAYFGGLFTSPTEDSVEETGAN
ncbi:MAG: hypothetical protein AAGF49_13725 [Pseudomonadota bacterium]